MDLSKTEQHPINAKYLTDANGLELVERDVFVGGSAPFSSSFFPVDSVIAAFDTDRLQSFTVHNDRPQAGSVHDDRQIKLLIDRRVTTNDNGGIPNKMHLNYDYDLILNFRLSMQKADRIDPSQTLRKRNILALETSKFKTVPKSPYLSEYETHMAKLLQTFSQAGVS